MSRHSYGLRTYARERIFWFASLHAETAVVQAGVLKLKS